MRGSLNSARKARRPFPYLSGLKAQRGVELIALELGPALTATAIAHSRLDSAWETVLLLACMLSVAMLLRRPDYPLHLIPFASATLYLLAPPLGAVLAVVTSNLDGYAAHNIQAGELVTPVLGAWVVTGMGAWLNHRFRREREVRIGVIGSHEFTRGLEAELHAVGVRGYRVIGCIDPERPCEGDAVAGVRCLGSLPELRKTIIDNGIELLVLGPLAQASTEADGRKFQAAGVSRLEVFERVADACLDLPVSMIEAGQLYEDLFGHVPLGTTTSAWFQYLLHPRYKASWPISKRLFDVGLGLIASVIVLPVLVIAAIAIKLTSPGPILHRQLRMGKGGCEMELIKLRTMRVHEGGPETGDEDELVTFVGHILRRLHINELPQLWLVLKGEMSLVGPRPEELPIVAELESRFTYYDRRHLVKPGITGWAQVRCGYSGTHIGGAWKLCHDLYYLKRRSPLFDLLIMLETLSTVVVQEPINRPDERFIVAARAGKEIRASLESA